MVYVTLREVYDLSTKVNEMTMLGIHTPSLKYLVRQYPGLFLNYRKFRFNDCSVKCACASRLPADPLQIGTDSTDIAPQDMFNPILYRAVSNDSFDAMNTRLYSLGYFGTSTNGSSVVASNSDTLPSTVDDFGVYYSLLANPYGWRTANPQEGFAIMRLKPLVWEQLYSASAPYSMDATDVMNGGGDSSELVQGQPYVPTWSASHESLEQTVTSVRGHAKPYPALPTFIQAKAGIGTYERYPVGEDDTQVANAVIDGLPDVSTVFVAQIIIPPAKLNPLYYRMVVEWSVEFTGLRPVSEIMTPGGMANLANGYAYSTDYSFSSSKTADAIKDIGVSESTVDVAKAGKIELVMQS